MSEAVVHHTIQRKRSPRGQSLVEFALVLPMLLVLLLGIADFGRVFAAGIILEAASRNGAEAAALGIPSKLSPNAPGDRATITSGSTTWRSKLPAGEAGRLAGDTTLDPTGS